MGFQTSVVILNDALHLIENDPEFGTRIGKAVRELSGRGLSSYRPRVDLYASNGRGSGSAGSVIETHHADGQVLIAFGGNTARSLGYAGQCGSSDEEMLQTIADRMGYRLVKK